MGAFAEIILILRGALPPPGSDEPADRERRDRAAMAAVGALQPVNGAEGRLAAQFVAADAWAMDCLRLAGERRLELEIARKCRAQAMSMVREGKSALRMLLRLQAGRQKMEADEAASDRAAWVEHSVVGMMEEALADAPAGRRVSPSLSKAPVVGGAARRNVASDEGKFRSVSILEKNPCETRRETEARLPDLSYG